MIRTDNDSDDPVIQLYDAKKRLRIQIGINPKNGAAFILLYDGKGNVKSDSTVQSGD